MRRLPASPILVLLLLAVPLPVTSASECPDAVCVSDEQTREGDDCQALDGESADHDRYYNLTAGDGTNSIAVRTRLHCEDRQGEGNDAYRHESMKTYVYANSTGRSDRIYVNYDYGGLYNNCGAGTEVDPDRTWIFDFHEPASTHIPMCRAAPFPSVVELLP